MERTIPAGLIQPQHKVGDQVIVKRDGQLIICTVKGMGVAYTLSPNYPAEFPGQRLQTVIGEQVTAHYTGE